MRAMVLRGPPEEGSDGSRLEPANVPIPSCGPGDVLIRVSVCAVCRTDLDLVEGRVAARSYPVVPGHQVVGSVAAVGTNVTERRAGDRVGVAWIRSACGTCRWCRAGLENLCPYFEATGCDADGGYAEYLSAPAAFTYVVPNELDDVHAAPLLCAGAIGWRSLRLAELTDGDPLGLTGFGASAHLVLQMTRLRYPKSPIYVFARSAGERAFARGLGAAWAGDTTDDPPSPLAAIIDTTPAWKPVVEALPRLMPGGRLVINAIRKIDADREELARIDYASSLWMEREITSVANVTRADVDEVLAFVASSPLRPTVETMPLHEAGVALHRLAAGGAIIGATVLDVGPDTTRTAAAR
jgi:propanol-preferring alcohol dehydrogenase